MSSPAQEAITGPGIAIQAPGLHKIVQPEQHGQIDVPGGGVPIGKSLPPTVQPVGPEGLHLGLMQTGLDGAHQSLSVIQSTDSLEMQVQIFRAGRTHAEGVNTGIAQTEQIVEDDGMERIGQLNQPLRRCVQMATFVCGADDEHAHVVAMRSGNRRLIVLTDEIPVQVHVIERIGLNRFNNHIGVPMGGKADMADAP